MVDNILLKIVNNMSFSKTSLCKFMCLNVQLMRHIWHFYPILLIILSLTNHSLQLMCVYIYLVVSNSSLYLVFEKVYRNFQIK